MGEDCLRHYTHQGWEPGRKEMFQVNYDSSFLISSDGRACEISEERYLVDGTVKEFKVEECEPSILGIRTLQ